MQETPDWDTLFARANSGDQQAFAAFLRAVSPALRAIIRAKGSALPADQHEDILQEVLLAIHLKKHTWKQGSPVRPWIYAITRYKVVDAFRKRGAAVHLDINPFAELLEDERLVPPLAGQDADYLLGQIDQRSAHLVRSIAIDGETAEDAGRTVGLSAGAARVALHRALRQLATNAERIRN